MANVVEDLRRATSAINEIQDELVTKGVIQQSEEVAIEDYPERIDKIGEEATITFGTYSNAGVAITNISNATKVNIDIPLSIIEGPFDRIPSINNPIILASGAEAKVAMKEDINNSILVLSDLFRFFNGSKITLDNEFYNENTGIDESSPLFLYNAFANIDSNAKLVLNHINCTNLNATFSYSNITIQGDSQGTLDLSKITMIPRIYRDNYNVQIIEQLCAEIVELIRNRSDIQTLIMPDMPLLEEGDGIYFVGDIGYGSTGLLYINNIDLSCAVISQNADEICRNSLKVDNTVGKITFKNGSGFGNYGDAAKITSDLAYDFRSLDPVATVESFLPTSFTPSTFTPTNSEKRIIVLNSEFNDQAYAADLASIETKFEAAGYTIQVANSGN